MAYFLCEHYAALSAMWLLYFWHFGLKIAGNLLFPSEMFLPNLNFLKLAILNLKSICVWACRDLWPISYIAIHLYLTTTELCLSASIRAASIRPTWDVSSDSNPAESQLLFQYTLYCCVQNICNGMQMKTISGAVMSASFSNCIAYLLCCSMICVNFRLSYCKLPRKYTNSNSSSPGGT